MWIKKMTDLADAAGKGEGGFPFGIRNEFLALNKRKGVF